MTAVCMDIIRIVEHITRQQLYYGL